MAQSKILYNRIGYVKKRRYYLVFLLIPSFLVFSLALCQYQIDVASMHWTMSATQKQSLPHISILSTP